jgi:hypothetical protein
VQEAALVEQPTPERTDIAALSAAVVAVSIASFVVPGPYDPITFIIFLTLTVLVCAYAWSNRRTALQSCAIAMILGLTLSPAVASIIEMAKASPDNELHLLQEGQLWNCPPDDGHEACSADKRHTDVPNYVVLLVWAASAVVIAAYDRSYQATRFPRNATKDP